MLVRTAAGRQQWASSAAGDVDKQLWSWGRMRFMLVISVALNFMQDISCSEQWTEEWFTSSEWTDRRNIGMQRTYGQKNDTGSEHRERNAYGTSMDKRKMHLVKSWRKKYAHIEPKNKITIIHLVLYSQCHFTFAKNLHIS